MRFGSIWVKTGGSIQSLRSNLKIGLEISGGDGGLVGNGGAVSSIMVVVAQGSFLLVGVDTDDGQTGIYVASF